MPQFWTKGASYGDCVRVALLGGGGFRVPLIHAALRASTVDSAIDELVLYDLSDTRLRVIADVLRDGRVRTSRDLDEAVEGADVILSAVRVGGLDGRVRDERVALDLGVLGQETVGAGGLLSAMRAVPVVVGHAERIAALAPRAWVVSMTNPAGIVTEVMTRVLGGRVVGVCDSPTSLVRRCCAALGVDAGPSLGRLPSAIEVDYLGINHLGWLRALSFDGLDRLPELIADPAALARIEEGRLFGPELIGALGAIPNEYVYWYYAAQEALAGVRAAGRTRGEHVRDEQRHFYAAAAAEPARARQLWQDANDERNRSYFAELREGERDADDVRAGGYEAIAVAAIEALVGGAGCSAILNVRNGSSVAALPADAVVEVPCVVDGAGVRALPVPPPTPHQLGLLSLVKDCERSAIDAALTGSRAAALRAFALHPLVGSLAAARALLDVP
jgi:6-phospho-beta-glucosidase